MKDLPSASLNWPLKVFNTRFLICVFERKNEFSLRVFATDVAHGDRPVDFIAFAQAARHAHFGRELFACGDFVVECARVELYVVGEALNCHSVKLSGSVK